jgi:CRISPR type I-D-associated protein Csc2
MSENKKLECGLISPKAKTVIVSAVLETVGQVRFGDGTEVNLTVTEKDLVPTPNGGFVEKVVFSGSKRRGVDRRTIHALRNQMAREVENNQDQGPLFDCYIPALCSECPTCWLYGSVGAVGETAKKKDYNIKSRVLYASALSVEPSDIAVAVHNRNAPNELDHTTGEAGIHSEELIKANVHFPTITVLDRVLDWEIGALAHALLENVNGNRYTAASARQGGMRFSEGNGGEKMIVVDVSERGIFPLETVKVPGEETDFNKVKQMFANAGNPNHIRKIFESQGFTCDDSKGGGSEAKSGETTEDSKDGGFKVKSGETTLWTVTGQNGVITVSQGEGDRAKVLMTRYVGDRAYGFLRARQEDCKRFFEGYNGEAWVKTLTEIRQRLRLGKASSAAALPEEVARLVESNVQKDQVIGALKSARLKYKEENDTLIITKGKQEIARLTVNSDGTVQLAKEQPAEAPREEDSEE